MPPLCIIFFLCFTSFCAGCTRPATTPPIDKQSIQEFIQLINNICGKHLNADIVVDFDREFNFKIFVSNKEHTQLTPFLIKSSSDKPQANIISTFPYPELALRISQAAQCKALAFITLNLDSSISDSEINSKQEMIRHIFNNAGFANIETVQFFPSKNIVLP